MLITYNYSITFIIIILTYILAQIAKKFFSKINLKYNFINYIIQIIIYFLGFSFAISLIPKFKAFAISLLAGSGLLVAIIGLAAQQIFSNIISGLFIELYQTFKVGDTIKINNLMGKVKEINLRHTVLIDSEHNKILIPNSLLNSQIIINLNK